MENRGAYSPLFDGVATWLMGQGLLQNDLETIVADLGRRLVAGGVPISRLGVGGMVLHPEVGAMDITWVAATDQLNSSRPPREAAKTPQFQNSPYFWAALEDIQFERFRLDEPKEGEFPLLTRLRGEGVSEYVIFRRDFGRRALKIWADMPAGLEGVVGSFGTNRIGGFSEMEIDYLRALATPLSLVIKTKMAQVLAGTLLDTYLGNYSGGQVLNGFVVRGDGRPIECVLWYCDLRGSTALAEEMSTEAYLAMLNEYFDCTAGAILDHGGEVLKFIGDAVMAIFPVDETERPVVDMCRAAMSTAREALGRVAAVNVKRQEQGLPLIRFGMSLHVGEVMYGNVGTGRRLDFTVIGPAVNQATRLEGLSKKLGTPVIASAQFNVVSPDELVALGAHEVAGIKGSLAAYTLPDLAPS